MREQSSLIERIGIPEPWQDILIVGIMLAILYGMYEHASKTKLVKILGPQVPLIVIALSLTTLNIFPAGGYPLYDHIYSYVLPIALAFLLLGIDIRNIMRLLGPRIFIAILLGTLAVMAGAFIGSVLMDLSPSQIKGVAATVGSYTGGSENFLAVSQALQVNHDLVPVYLAATLPVTIAFYILGFGIAGQPRLLNSLNKWLRPRVDTVSLAKDVEEKVKANITIAWSARSFSLMLAIVFIVVGLSYWLAEYIPEIHLPGGGTITIDSILVLTLVALIVASSTRWTRIENFQDIG